MFLNIQLLPHSKRGPGSSVGIATDCGLDGLGSNTGRDEIFRPFRRAVGLIQPSVKWVPGLSRGCSAAGVYCWPLNPSTDYGLDDSPPVFEIESRWGRDFPPVQTAPGAHRASCKMGTGSFPGVECGRGVLLTTYPLDWLRPGRFGIEYRWERDFLSIQTGPGAHRASCKMGTGSFPGGKEQPGRAANHSLPSSAAVM